MVGSCVTLSAFTNFVRRKDGLNMKILLEISARHIHVSQDDLETLFGENAVLTPKKDLSQPGQFACEEKVKVVGPKGELVCSILGPVRPSTQVEISLTEARKLGVSVPIRESGDISESAGCKLVGPAGEVELKEGVMAAKRHIHMTPENAEEYGVSDKQIVRVKTPDNGRCLTFDDVVVRVREDFAPAMHIDTDEANAAGISGEAYGEIIK